MSPDPARPDEPPDPGPPEMSPDPARPDEPPDPGPSEMSPDPARPDEPPDPGPPEVPPDPAAPEVPPDPAAPDEPPGPGPPEVPPDPAAPEVPLPPMFQAGAQVTVVGAPQRGYIPRLAFGFPKGATTLVSGWIQARQGRLVLATGFVEYCGCPVGLLRAAKKPKRLYFYILY